MEEPVMGDWVQTLQVDVENDSLKQVSQCEEISLRKERTPSVLGSSGWEGMAQLLMSPLCCASHTQTSAV